MPCALFKKSGIQNRYTHQIGSVMNLPIAIAHNCRCGINFRQGIFLASSAAPGSSALNAPVAPRLLSPGERYSASHAITQSIPIAPVHRNAHLHPNWIVIHGTVKGVTSAPTFVPALNIPVASARSFFGNHSATLFTEARKLPPSPNPSVARAIANPVTDRAAAWAIAAMLHTITASEYPRREPSRSISRPTTSDPAA